MILWVHPTPIHYRKQNYIDHPFHFLVLDNGDDYEENVDTFEVVSEIENKVEELALDEAYRLLNDIPTEYRPDDSKISNMCINVSGAEGVAESHMDYGDYEGHSFSSRGDWNPEIDYIFLRDE